MKIQRYVLAVILLASVALGFAPGQQGAADPIGNKTCCSAEV